MKKIIVALAVALLTASLAHAEPGSQSTVTWVVQIVHEKAGVQCHEDYQDYTMEQAGVIGYSLAVAAIGEVEPFYAPETCSGKGPVVGGRLIKRTRTVIVEEEILQ